MRVNGIDLGLFTAKQRAIITAVVLSAPFPARMAQLIEAVYPDPDMEPESADRCIQHQISRTREKLANLGWRLTACRGRTGGYYLEQAHAGN